MGRALSFPGSGPQSYCSLVPCSEGFNVLSTQVLNISTDGSSPGVPLRRPLDLAVKTLPRCSVPLSAFVFGSDIDGHMRWLKQKVTPLPSLSFQDPLPAETSRSGRESREAEGGKQAEKFGICSGNSLFQEAKAPGHERTFLLREHAGSMEAGSLTQKDPATEFSGQPRAELPPNCLFTAAGSEGGSRGSVCKAQAVPRTPMS